MKKSSLDLDVHRDLQQILDCIAEGVVIYNSEPRAIMMNKCGCEQLGIKDPSEFLGRTPDQYVQEGLIDKSVLKIAVENKQETSGIVYTRDGNEFISKSRPFFNPDGSLKFAVMTTMSAG